jgi:hypothetical protein
MIESPLIQELLAERIHKVILILETRFGPVPQDIASALTAILDDKTLDNLIGTTAPCRDLGAFRVRLQDLSRAEPI